MADAVVDEQQALIDAGLAVLRRHGSEGLTVNDVLAEAGLSTRAFYRHFESKDALVLAIYAHDATGPGTKCRSGSTTPLTAGRARVLDRRDAGARIRQPACRATWPLAREGMRLQAEFPEEFAAVRAADLDPLVEVLRALDSPDPVRDARVDARGCVGDRRGTNAGFAAAALDGHAPMCCGSACRRWD